MERRSCVVLAWALCTAWGLIGCETAPGMDPGESVYRNPLSDGNTFTCSTCHAIAEPADDGLRRPGHPIGDATRRPTFKNGQLTDVRDAVNTCVTEWMGAAPLAADDSRWLDLFAWLDAQAPEPSAPALSFEVVQPPISLVGGDASAGRSLFNSSCSVCHGNDAAGTQLAPSLATTELMDDYVARRVRTSGDADSPTYPDLTGGRMPFWSGDRYSDDELLDVIAFLNELQSGNLPGTGGTIGEVGDCDSTHPRVGWTATLSMFAHDVSGTATVLNDCTIQITNFTFDGGGIDVRVYGGVGGNYDDGFALTDDLRSSTPYDGFTVNLVLPADRTLDDVDGVSVWCVPVGVSFGDGLLAPP